MLVYTLVFHREGARPGDMLATERFTSRAEAEKRWDEVTARHSGARCDICGLRTGAYLVQREERDATRATA